MPLRLIAERVLPRELSAGTKTVVFCAGACAHTDAAIADLRLIADGVEYRARAFGFPRPDLVAAELLGDCADALHCGFWGSVPLSGGEPGDTIVVEVEASLAGGSVERAELGRLQVVEPPPAPQTAARPQATGPGGTIAVCLASYEPDPELLAIQLESLRNQTDRDWICLISDDGSGEERFGQLQALVGDDPRFAISRSTQRQGFYRNFERGLAMVPPDAPLVALSDQDDRWHRDKLATLRGAIGGAMLAYSDLRLVEADGRVLRDTLWRGRSNNHRDLVSMLVANTITGASMLFRRELLQLALPFPDTPGFQFHDAWLAVIALAAGEVAYVDRPLYDYVQHPGAVFGDVTHGGRKQAGRPRGRRRAAYLHGYLGRAVQAEVALLRCGAEIDPGKRRALERFIAAEYSSYALSWLALRPLRGLRGRTETLGSEVELAGGVAWKRLAELAARHRWLERGPLAEASPPPPDAFSQRRLRRWRARI